MNGLSVLKLFQCSNGDLKFSEHAYSIYKVGKPRMTELGQGVGVRAHYPTQGWFMVSSRVSNGIRIVHNVNTGINGIG